MINSSILREYLFHIGSLFYIKLIYELKLNLLPNPKENNLASGSYERPFGKEDTKIFVGQTFDEMTSIINASRGQFYNASFDHEETSYSIANYIQLTELCT